MKSSTKNTAKKVNKARRSLTVSQSQQLDNTFEEHQRLTRRD
jgi:hypothetical protein